MECSTVQDLKVPMVWVSISFICIHGCEIKYTDMVNLNTDLYILGSQYDISKYKGRGL